ncbi:MULTISPECIES: hypothetical protein [Aphanothece]|uniref:hypothetical protein n=1 Tax=Aphanothece TaxID=1121 RepID=UPI00398550CB
MTLAPATSGRSATDQAFGIVVVHRSPSPYLAVCLRQAKLWNPHCPVVLAGDASNRSMAVDRFIAIDALERTPAHSSFLSDYRHYSPWQSQDWERFCIERWFVVLAVMRREGWDHCLALDSDVLLFCDAASESRDSRSAAVVLSRWDAQRALPHCTYINQRGALEAFCDHIAATYRSESRLTALKARNQKKLDRYWISDMSLWQDWAERTSHRVQIRDPLPTAGAAYDSCIETVEGFQRSNPLPLLVRPWKRIVFRQGRPLAFRRQDGRPLALNCVHYHGRFKALMERHARGRNDGLVAGLILLREKLKAYPPKLRRGARGYGEALRRRLRGRSAPAGQPSPRP